MITAIVLLVSSIGIYGNKLVLSDYKGQVSTVLSFNYEGIDEGLNPQGGTFEIHAFKEEGILEEVVEKLNLQDKGIDAQMLAQNMIIKSYVPKDVLDRILPKGNNSNVQMQDVANSTYHPTQYQFTLQIPRGMKMDKKLAKQVMDTFVEVYQAYFVNKYKDTQSLDVAIQKVAPERYDYSEYVTLMEGQIGIVKEYLLAKEAQAKGFKSSATGLTFSDLVAQIEFIQDVELNNIRALVDTFIITRDSKQLKSIYENRLYKMKKEREQYQTEIQSVSKAIADYKKDPTVILENGAIAQIPETFTLDKEQSKLPVYEELVQKSIDLEVKLNNLIYDIQYHEQLLAKLEQSESNPIDTARYTKEVKQNIEYVAKLIDKAMEDIKLTTDDYYENEVFDQSVTQMGNVIYESSFKLGFVKDTLMVGIITGFGMLIAIVYVLVKQEKGVKGSQEPNKENIAIE